MNRDPRLDPQLADLLTFLDDAGAPPLNESSVDEARAGFRALTVGMVTPDQVVEVGSVAEGEAAGRPTRVYRPALEDNPAPGDPAPGDNPASNPSADAAAEVSADPSPNSAGNLATVAYFHGGGFVIGDLDTHDQTCRRLCRDTGAVVVSVDYRLAPEHPYPAAVEDCLAAAEWVSGHLDDFGGGTRFGVAGDSAGGNLAAICAQELRTRVAAQLLIYPAVHMLGDYPSRKENADGYFLTYAMLEWFLGHYVGSVEGIDLDSSRVSPLLGDLVALPPAVVVTAQFDPLRDEGEAYAAALQRAGVSVDQVRYDGLIHGFVDLGDVSAASADAVADMNRRFAEILHD